MDTERNGVPATPRRWAMFKTVRGRVTFTVATAVLLTLVAALYGVVRWIQLRESTVTIGPGEWQALGITLGLILVGAIVSRLLGGILITRKVKKLARVMAGLAEGKTDPASLPYGLGELDGLTADAGRVAAEMRELKAKFEQRVHMRTSELEVSKGMSDLDRARTEALIDSVAEGVVAIDREGKITFLNDVAKQGLWWNPEKALGVPVQSAYRLENEKEVDITEEHWPTVPALTKGERVVTPAPTKPFYLRRADKTRFPVKITVTPLRADGQDAGALLTIADITLEVDFDKRKSEFISIAAHQLRSPATAIKMMADMMRDGSFGEMNEKQKDWMGKMYNSSDMLIDLVGELLNVSRLEAGSELHKEPHDFAEFTKSILLNTEPLLLVKKQKFAVVEQGNATAPFDKVTLGEVMKNFLSNAHKYSPEGSTITVTIGVADGKARFAVTDQGMGIPKADQAKMFNKFFRASNAALSTIVGTGLGLYYCKTVVEKHGGEIGFDSEEGKGSTFWFTLPV